MTLRLYTAARAAAPYRVRIALNLKGLAYTPEAVNLAAGDQRCAPYTTLNRQGLTPTLATDDGSILVQSLAIIEWLEETHPEPALLPKGADARAVVRAMANVVACDIHPLNNLRIQQTLEDLGLDADARGAWTRRWIGAGFDALEPMIAQHGQGWSFGDQPSLADCCLVPQVVNSRRFGFDLSPYPHIAAVWERSKAHPAFQAAAPERQPDFAPA